MKQDNKFEDWFEVNWDEKFIYIKISLPEQKFWLDKFSWSSINSVWFESTNYLYSNTATLYFFTTERVNSYVIPLKAKGGNALWESVLAKKLFDAELAANALASLNGIFCYPAVNLSVTELSNITAKNLVNIYMPINSRA